MASQFLLSFVAAATLLAAAAALDEARHAPSQDRGAPLDEARDAPSQDRRAQYRTLDDRFDPPHFTSADAWAPLW